MPRTSSHALIAASILVPLCAAAGPAAAQPANDDCPAAIPIGDGVVAGDTSGATLDGASGSGSDRDDVWFRYVAPADARMSAFFVDADPFVSFVLSVHASCPGTPHNKIGVGGWFEVAAGDEVVLRVAVREDEIGGPFSLDVGPVGTISGTVTDAASGGPIAGVGVAISTDFGWERGARTGDDGGYVVDVPRPGTYYLSTRAEGHADEIWDDVACAAQGCFDDFPGSGAPIEVGRSVGVAGIDFALERLGAISGRVTAAATGEPVPGALVVLYDRFGSEAAFGSADAGGDYALGGLFPGTYFATASDPGFETGLFDGLPCSDPDPFSGDCDPLVGTPIAVELNAVSAVDFALETGGRITGTVTVAATGDPVPSLGVHVYDGAGQFVRSASTDGDGLYVVGGLAAGTYRAQVSGLDELAAEVYANMPCSLNGCPEGDPIVVEQDSTTPGIDFALDRFGRVVGTVTEEATGAALEDVLIRVYDRDGFFASAEVTDAAGRYAAPFLFTGTYFATATLGGYVEELYDDIRCPPPPIPCDVTAGDPIAVEIGADTADVDFALARQGISGTVIDLARGTAIPFARVEIWNQQGLLERSLLAPAGLYSVGDLSPGTYFVTTDTGRYLDQLYAGIPCPGGGGVGCDPTAGTPVRVRRGAVTEGIDFALASLGSISGTVRDAAGEPLPFASVTIWNADGSFARSDNVIDEASRYTVRGLPAGTYYATATADDGFLAELYDDRPCPDEGCDPTAGVPIPVALGATTTGIDFVLDRTGALFGTVREAATGAPLGRISVLVWDADNDFVRSVETETFGGTYAVSGLLPGTYFVTTRSFAGEYRGFSDQLYDELPCFLGVCDPTAGTPVEVGLNSPSAGVDFALDLEQGISGKITHQETDLPLAFANLEIWNADGQRLDVLQTGASGTYAVGLPLGTYFVSTETRFNSLFDVTDEVYDGVPCPRFGCDPTAGTPVAVTAGAVARDVDFALSGEVSTCRETASALCLNDGRFRVEVFWQDFEGDVGLGQAEALTGDSGTFWFFGPDNVEVVVKVLDACVEPFDRFWVFAAGLTNVATRLTVTDTLTDEVRTYENPLGSAFELIRDTSAFATCDLVGGGSSASAEVPDPAAVGRELEGDLARLAARDGGVSEPAVGSPAGLSQGSCVPSATRLCLGEGRFEVSTSWRTAQGDAGAGQAVPLTDDTGYFWFFGADNVEVILKVLDACVDPFNHFWVFAAGLSDVEVTVRVTDTVSGEVEEYFNPLGTAFRPIQDTAAFDTCP